MKLNQSLQRYWKKRNYLGSQEIAGHHPKEGIEREKSGGGKRKGVVS
jgi:hypothetical protein